MDSTYASFLNFIKMSDGFARLGHEVTVVINQPKSLDFTEDDLKKRYSLSENLSCITFRQASSKQRRLTWNTIIQAHKIKPDFAYIRAYAPTFFLSLMGVPSAVELHGMREKDFYPVYWLAAASHLPAFRCLSTISPNLKERYAHLGIQKEKVLVQPDAVDVDIFGKTDEDNTLYEGDGPHLVYSGHLYDYKGIPTLIDCAKLLPDCSFHLVGGHDEDIQSVRKRLDAENIYNIKLHGYVEYSQLAKYLHNADILLHPYSAKHSTSSSTSPMKLGEYMLSSKPIVATDIQGLRNWVSDEHVEYVAPDNPAAFAEGIRNVLEDPNKNRKRTRLAKELAQGWSFESRARNILTFSNR